MRDLVRRSWRRLRRQQSQWSRLEAEGIVSVGVGTYGHHGIVVHEFRAPDGTWTDGRLHIGNYCSIAPCEVFLGGNHRSDRVSQYPFAVFHGLPGAAEDVSTKGDVVVGSDVWLGMNSTLLSGVRIGHGAVVATRAVVTRSVRPYAVVAGNPAREVGRRFDDETVGRLLRSRWWEWPDERVRREVGHLLAPPTPTWPPSSDGGDDLLETTPDERR